MDLVVAAAKVDEAVDIVPGADSRVEDECVASCTAEKPIETGASGERIVAGAADQVIVARACP